MDSVPGLELADLGERDALAKQQLLDRIPQVLPGLRNGRMKK